MQNRTRVKQNMIIELLKGNGGNVEMSCKDAKSSRTQFYIWMNKYSEFKSSVVKVYANIENFTTSMLYKKALQQDPLALKILKDQTEKKIKRLNNE